MMSIEIKIHHCTHPDFHFPMYAANSEVQKWLHAGVGAGNEKSEDRLGPVAQAVGHGGVVACRF